VRRHGLAAAGHTSRVDLARAAAPTAVERRPTAVAAAMVAAADRPHAAAVPTAAAEPRAAAAGSTAAAVLVPAGPMAAAGLHAAAAPAAAPMAAAAGLRAAAAPAAAATAVVVRPAFPAARPASSPVVFWNRNPPFKALQQGRRTRSAPRGHATQRGNGKRSAVLGGEFTAPARMNHSR
jgi:hypothetical protein